MSTNRQLDLFVALIGDVPLRDEREAMTAPLVALSKNKRTRIEWIGPSGQRVLVTAPEEYGVATIWDYDVLLWAISQINAAMKAHLAVSPRISFQPYSLLRAIGRDTGGKGYAELKAALHRLRATGVSYESKVLDGKRRKQGAFNLLTAFEFEEDEEGRAKGAWIELPTWLFEAVQLDRSILAISPRYFDLTSGLDRFLYRLARRHVGRQQQRLDMAGQPHVTRLRVGRAPIHQQRPQPARGEAAEQRSAGHVEHRGGIDERRYHDHRPPAAADGART